MFTNFFRALIFISIVTSGVYAGCGGCAPRKPKPVAQTVNYDLIEKVNKNGNIEGYVLASCGMCNFNMEDRNDCSLAIKIGETAYDVKGTGIDDHGDSHAKDGFCNAVRVAEVTGKINKDKFYSKSLVLQQSK